MSIDLEQVVLDGGARFVNFFEGRILTGRDLRDEQSAARKSRNALGRSIGWGVVHGLEVSDATPSGAGAAPAVQVRAGLGVNREGQPLELAEERTVRLAELDVTSPERGEAIFDLCEDQPTTSGAPTAEGFHVLTVAPATVYEQQAPKSGLGDGGTASGCGRRYVTLGLRFRLVQFDPAELMGGELGTQIGTLATATGDSALSRLRNLVAHLGLGTTRRAEFSIDPFGAVSDSGSATGGWGLEGRLATGSNPLLMACELPLAVLRLRAGQIAYVDMWTIRRSLRRPSPSANWSLLASPARAADDAATLFQFQDHLAWLLDRQINLAETPADEYFRYLPPVGFLPLTEPNQFLHDDRAPIPLDPGRVIPLVEQALTYPAVDLSASPMPGFTTYRVMGSEGWILFVSDLVPSAELKAQRCAELEERSAQLEDRILILEEMQEAPATFAGRVMLHRNFDDGPVSEPLRRVVLRITDADGNVIEAESGADGSFTQRLQPGIYSIVPFLDGHQITARRVEGIEVTHGGMLTQDFEIHIDDLIRRGDGR